MLRNVNFEPLFSKVIQFEADSMKAVFWAKNYMLKDYDMNYMLKDYDMNYMLKDYDMNYMLKDYDMIQQFHQLVIPQYTALDHGTELLIKILITHLF